MAINFVLFLNNDIVNIDQKIKNMILLINIYKIVSSYTNLAQLIGTMYNIYKVWSSNCSATVQKMDPGAPR